MLVNNREHSMLQAHRVDIYKKTAISAIQVVLKYKDINAMKIQLNKWGEMATIHAQPNWPNAP